MYILSSIYVLLFFLLAVARGATTALVQTMPASSDLLLFLLRWYSFLSNRVSISDKTSTNIFSPSVEYSVPLGGARGSLGSLP